MPITCCRSPSEALIRPTSLAGSAKKALSWAQYWHVHATSARTERLEQHRQRQFRNGWLPSLARPVIGVCRLGRSRRTESVNREGTQLVGERRLVRVRRLVETEGGEPFEVAGRNFLAHRH